jgi:TonB family protein
VVPEVVLVVSRLVLTSAAKLAHTSAKLPAPLAFCRIARKSTDREKSVVEPQSNPFSSGKPFRTFPGDRPAERTSGSSGMVAVEIALSSLREQIAAGNQLLEAVLANITEAARQFTGASGAALAMWKDGAMVCRARSGDTAPPLGAKLSADTGISGQCMRSGEIQNCADTENDPLVDLEVCRSLGLRSIAVLPIQGWRGINGILEVFSTSQAAFTEQHISVLKQLGALAERARASQPHSASSAAPKISSVIERSQPGGLLPASDRVGDVALAFMGPRKRPFVMVTLILIAAALVGCAIWLGWRGPSERSGKAHAAALDKTQNASTNDAPGDPVIPVSSNPPTRRPPDNDPVWRPDPGGQSLLPSGRMPPAGSPVKLASKVDVVSTKKKSPASSTNTNSNRTLLPAEVAANLAVARETSPPSKNSDGVLPANVLEPTSLPVAASPVARGVSGGEILHRVPPVYPAQARQLREEGTVTLTATIMEDGSVRDVKVVDGPPGLTQSAVDAVQHWRYQPFTLDGQPVTNEIKINVDFKLSGDDTEGGH